MRRRPDESAAARRRTEGAPHASALAPLLLIAPLVLACAGTAPLATGSAGLATPVASVSTAATQASSSPEPSPTRTARPTRTPAPVATPQLEFSSSVYPYSIRLPSDAFQPGPANVLPPTGTWVQARQAWDGTSVISPSRPIQNDMTFDSDRDEFFVTGHQTEDDLDAFVARLVPSFATWHGCSPTPASRDIQIDGVPAVLVGSMCGGAAKAARAFVVHDGFGLVFMMRSFREMTREDLMERLERYLAEVDLRP